MRNPTAPSPSAENLSLRLRRRCDRRGREGGAERAKKGARPADGPFAQPLADQRAPSSLTPPLLQTPRSSETSEAVQALRLLYGSVACLASPSARSIRLTRWPLNPPVCPSHQSSCPTRPSVWPLRSSSKSLPTSWRSMRASSASTSCATLIGRPGPDGSFPLRPCQNRRPATGPPWPVLSTGARPPAKQSSS
jgi:hypothetical protein